GRLGGCAALPRGPNLVRPPHPGDPGWRNRTAPRAGAGAVPAVRGPPPGPAEGGRLTIRIAHLSDIHFGAENGAAVACATGELRSGAFDLIVVSGDLTRFAEVSELRSAASWLR